MQQIKLEKKHVITFFGPEITICIVVWIWLCEKYRIEWNNFLHRLRDKFRKPLLQGLFEDISSRFISLQQWSYIGELADFMQQWYEAFRRTGK